MVFLKVAWYKRGSALCEEPGPEQAELVRDKHLHLQGSVRFDAVYNYGGTIKSGVVQMW